jgi:predicted amino acid racemase
MLSQVDRVVAHADVSFNSELEIIGNLSSAARKAGRTHGVVLMVELGDLREGIMPGDLENIVRETLRFPNIVLRGIGTNLACLSGVSPDAKNMAELSALADSIDATFGPIVGVVSGGNSGNLQWALSGADTGRINDLRLGESVFLGCEPLHRQLIDGLHTDAIRLVAEVIESKIKPSQPRGEIAQTAFGEKLPATGRGLIPQTVLAIGCQDTDPLGLHPSLGIEILGASSDHLVVSSDRYQLSIGAEVAFQLNYSALVRAMTSPYVTKVVKNQSGHISSPSITSPTKSIYPSTDTPTLVAAPSWGTDSRGRWQAELPTLVV